MGTGGEKSWGVRRVEIGADFRVTASKGDSEESSAGANEGPCVADEMRKIQEVWWKK